MELNGWCFDIEADNLYLQSTKIWYIGLKSLDGERKLQVFPFREGKEASKRKLEQWINSFEDSASVVTFNGLGYDLWALWKFFGIVPRVGKAGKDYLGDKLVQFVDGYVLSMYLNPNSPKHSLGYLSGEDEDGKIDYRESLIEAGAMKRTDPKGHEFTFWHDLMITYCDRDVDTTCKEVKKLWQQAQEMYKQSWLHPSFRQMQKDYWLYSAQAYTGVKFHKERALTLVEKVEAEMLLIKNEVDPKLPARELKTAEQAFTKQAIYAGR
jgi:hypothetical protein